ncbi:hypothetical protein [Burkholderia sp. Bp9143]|uniref:hypothetical protein n=1 Tax=Burkholderia sp. Bp9143 TaxID=2184574 RepID=UPI000F5A1A0F|nr:hypothetical protein [Burkholderia sp. Bp9143]
MTRYKAIVKRYSDQAFSIKLFFQRQKKPAKTSAGNSGQNNDRRRTDCSRWPASRRCADDRGKLLRWLGLRGVAYPKPIQHTDPRSMPDAPYEGRSHSMKARSGVTERQSRSVANWHFLLDLLGTPYRLTWPITTHSRRSLESCRRPPYRVELKH